MTNAPPDLRMTRLAYTTATGLLALLLLPVEGMGQERPATWVVDGEVLAPHYFAVRVSDVDRASEWYRAAFGLEEIERSRAEDGTWQIVNVRNEHLFVEIVRDDRSANAEGPAGLYKVGFHVPDVRVVADRVAASGFERPRVLHFERFGVRIIQLHDPDGNTIQLFSPLDPEG
jgi:catechol 2,3-dioxygenase-like lactoylglutathione lyase family enzyme